MFHKFMRNKLIQFLTEGHKLTVQSANKAKTLNHGKILEIDWKNFKLNLSYKITCNRKL
jgi:hypothetical protein